VDEARTVIRRLERIEALQGADAPAKEVLAEVRQLLAEGEAWLSAERAESDGGGGIDPVNPRPVPAERAARALDDCRARLTSRAAR
jgi:hypothetical protein